jgi:hypothetical protein
MSQKTDLEKMKIILAHWLEHSSSHQKEYLKWIPVALENNQKEVAELIEKAVNEFKAADTSLHKALEKLGGSMKDGHHHHHHH